MGCTVGREVGEAEGVLVLVGNGVGPLGVAEGIVVRKIAFVGKNEGLRVGFDEGNVVGGMLGCFDGNIVGVKLGLNDGNAVGCLLGLLDGSVVGGKLGRAEGDVVGRKLGRTVRGVVGRALGCFDGYGVVGRADGKAVGGKLGRVDGFIVDICCLLEGNNVGENVELIRMVGNADGGCFWRDGREDGGAEN